VRALAPDVAPPRELAAVLTGVVGGLASTFGAMFAIGLALLDRGAEALAAVGVAVAGTWMTVRALRRLR
jgi:hypothetical protein